MAEWDADQLWRELAPSLRRAAGFGVGLGAVGESGSAEGVDRRATFDGPPAESWHAPSSTDGEATRTAPDTDAIVRFVLSHSASSGEPASERLTVDEFQQLVIGLGAVSPEQFDRIAQQLAENQRGNLKAICELLIETGVFSRVSRQGDRPGTVYGNYLLLDEIGAGGMGRVYRSVDLSGEQLVALKVLRTSLLDADRSIRRFRREIRASSRLRHPHIVRSLDAEVSRDLCYLAMEYVRGCDLTQFVQRHHPLPLRLALDYLVQAARGLEHAHGHGVVHRDVKPSNLLLGAGGVIKVSDLGLARLVSSGEFTVSDDDHELTGEGAALGTHSYMAPEQTSDAQQVDHRADIYSLGYTLYFLLLGRSPVQGLSLEEKICWHRGARVPRLSELRTDVSPELDRVFGRMVAKSPDERQASMREVIGQLQRCRDRLDNQSGILPELSGVEFVPPTPSEALADTVDFSGTDRSRPDASRGARWSALVGLPLLMLASVFAVAFVPAGWHSWGPEGRSELLPQRHRTLVNSIGMRFVEIPAGEFEMGALPGEPGAKEIEYPRHLVHLTRPFWLARTEVTRGEYEIVMPPGSLPPLNPKRDATQLSDTRLLPVTNVSWFDANQFCERLSELAEERQAGRRYRLPTEAEWEYACRGGTNTYFAFGDQLSRKEADFRVFHDQLDPLLAEDEGSMTQWPVPVGSFEPNDFGLFDMHSNVWEWCQDRFTPYPDRPVVDPRFPQQGDAHVVRGGACYFSVTECRSANRQSFRPDYRADRFGFRVVCEIVPPAHGTRSRASAE